MVCKNGTTFFTQKEYEHLKFKHLSLKDYKLFIKDLHLLRVEDVLNKREGSLLPLNIGVIKILKKFRLKPVKEYYGTYYNEHSMGYIFSINFLQPLTKVKYKAFYTSLYKLEDNKREETPRFGVYKFWGNRTTLKPRLIENIRNNKMDYDKIS